MTDLTGITEAHSALIRMKRKIERLAPCPEREQMLRDIRRALIAWVHALVRIEAIIDTPSLPRDEIKSRIRAAIKPVLMALTQGGFFLQTIKHY